MAAMAPAVLEALYGGDLDAARRLTGAEDPVVDAFAPLIADETPRPPASR